MEISRLLVIVGLIFAAMLIAQNMIASTKVKSVVTQLQKLDTTVSTFQTKYSQLPGDSSLFDNPGNNNGLLDDNNNEFYHHLSQGIDFRNARGEQYISYEPAKAPYSEKLCPRLDIDQTTTETCLKPEYSKYNGMERNNYNYQSYSGNYGVLSGQDAFNVDSKMDDGKPSSGNIGSDCVEAEKEDYATASGRTGCSFHIQLGASTGN